jgi:hypothetical protein
MNTILEGWSVGILEWFLSRYIYIMDCSFVGSKGSGGLRGTVCFQFNSFFGVKSPLHERPVGCLKSLLKEYD